jgi:outer membrane protein OmpA-like peptidoglycan-associated protein
MLPTLTGTAVEVPGQGIRITVTNLAVGAHIAVMIYDSAVPVLGSAAEVPWFTEGATGVSTLMVNSIKWTANSNNVISGTISRSTPLVAGPRYRVMYRQATGSMNSMSSVSSSSVTAYITLTKDAAAATAAAGVTVTDTKVYSTPAATPAKVSAESAITVMTPEQAKVQEIVSMTPAVCLPNDDDIVFIDTGKCIAKFVNEKTGKVLRTLKTTVVADEVSSLNVGNEVAILAPIYFDAGSSTVSPAGLARIKSIKDQVTAAGSVLLVGHSGILMGNTPENIALAKARATSTAKALKTVGAKGPFYATSAGALDPASNKMTVAAQAKNRRVVIVLVP